MESRVGIEPDEFRSRIERDRSRRGEGYLLRSDRSDRKDRKDISIGVLDQTFGFRDVDVGHDAYYP